MAPPPITEDYYMVLQVEKTAASELIIRSYKRLALKLHPDRNNKHDATEAFQKLGRAYETLKDESRRRAYDLIYPSITRSRPSPQNTQTSRPSPASTPQTDALGQAAQVAALQRSKQERSARWRTKNNVLDSSIFELRRAVRRLEQEIRNLDSILAAEAATEAQKNSWGTWFMSPIRKKVEDNEDEEARKDRGRQERRIEKDMKERRLDLRRTDLKKEEALLRKAKEEVDAADRGDDEKIRMIQAMIWAREDMERQKREKADRDRIEKILKQQQREKRERQAAEALRQQQQQQQQREKRERQAAEALRQQQAERLAAEQKRQEEEDRKWQKIIDDEIWNRREQYAPRNYNIPERNTRQTYTPTCHHDGWWSKVQGRTACPECDDIWTYLLECPSCTKRACPKCQSAIRPRVTRDTARTFRRAPPRVRTPSPNFDFDWD